MPITTYLDVLKHKKNLKNATTSLAKQIFNNELAELELLKKNLEELQHKIEIVDAIFVTNLQK